MSESKLRDLYTAVLAGVVVVGLIVFGIVNNSSETLIFTGVSSVLFNALNLIRTNKVKDTVEQVAANTNGNMTALIERNQRETAVTRRHSESEESK